jgi:putative oxidoreductase
MSGLGDFFPYLLHFAVLVVAALLFLGFGTPYAAIGEVAVQVGNMALERRYDEATLIAIALGVALAMLGPGACSLDARIFGRKRII